MTRSLVLAICVALWSCSTNASHSPIEGIWLPMDAAARFPEGCASGSTIEYRADGTYSLWGEAGRWRLNGRALMEEATSVDEALVDEASAKDVGKRFFSTIQWLSRDRFRKRFADGGELEFRRCPAHVDSIVSLSAWPLTADQGSDRPVH